MKADWYQQGSATKYAIVSSGTNIEVRRASFKSKHGINVRTVVAARNWPAVWCIRCYASPPRSERLPNMTTGSLVNGCGSLGGSIADEKRHDEIHLRPSAAKHRNQTSELQLRLRATTYPCTQVFVRIDSASHHTIACYCMWHTWWHKSERDQ